MGPLRFNRFKWYRHIWSLTGRGAVWQGSVPVFGEVKSASQCRQYCLIPIQKEAACIDLFVIYGGGIAKMDVKSDMVGFLRCTLACVCTTRSH